MNERTNQAAGDDGRGDDGRDRLREIDETLERLRAEVPGPPTDVADFADAGQYLAAREELEGQIELLEAERERLRERLEQS